MYHILKKYNKYLFLVLIGSIVVAGCHDDKDEPAFETDLIGIKKEMAGISFRYNLIKFDLDQCRNQDVMVSNEFSPSNVTYDKLNQEIYCFHYKDSSNSQCFYKFDGNDGTLVDSVNILIEGEIYGIHYNENDNLLYFLNQSESIQVVSLDFETGTLYPINHTTLGIDELSDDIYTYMCPFADSYVVFNNTDEVLAVNLLNGTVTVITGFNVEVKGLPGNYPGSDNIVFIGSDGTGSYVYRLNINDGELSALCAIDYYETPFVYNESDNSLMTFRKYDYEKYDLCRFGVENQTYSPSHYTYSASRPLFSNLFSNN